MIQCFFYWFPIIYSCADDHAIWIFCIEWNTFRLISWSNTFLTCEIFDFLTSKIHFSIYLMDFDDGNFPYHRSKTIVLFYWRDDMDEARSLNEWMNELYKKKRNEWTRKPLRALVQSGRIIYTIHIECDSACKCAHETAICCTFYLSTEHCT